MSARYVYLAMFIYIVIGCWLAYAARVDMKKDIMDYFLGGRSTGGIVAALSYSATTYSAFMMVGLVGFTYSGGVGALGFELVYLAGLSLVAFFGPRFWLLGKKYSYISPYEMLADRYNNKWISIISSFTACIFLIPYLSVQLMGVGYLMNGLSDGEIPFMIGVLIATVLAIVWALVAGLRSVTWTDSLQSLIMIIVSVLVLLFIVYSRLGGFLNFFAILEKDFPEFLSVPGPGFFNFKTFLGLTLPWFFFSISNPQVSQRLFIPDSLRSMRTMIKGFLVFGFIYTMVSVFWGFTALILLPGLESADMATPVLLGSTYVPVTLALFAMVGITAAAISTIDSIMLTLSSLVLRDLYPKKNRDQKNNLDLVTPRVIIILIAFLGFLFASQQFDLIAALSVASSVGLLIVVPTIFGAFFWRKSTAAGSITSLLSGCFTAVYLQFTGWSPWGYPAGVWTLVISSLTFIIVSLLTIPPEEKADELLDYLDKELSKRNIL
ncbi:sodium:solute symporter family protein [Iocasia frigidifontis]|uniref:Sodium:solute symporter family protein n=1 Tax=Iocasia fonsfrigidae TaxID=2682810 RepID=A0A8A7KFB1_9FIRM|nr:sodium:solute symporter family protein [Iocasia fonsfrigidae]QTL97587.1 sodium:solute symporter family protein [Iocasia fonsfrigidae]